MNFETYSPCHRTTIAHFLNHGKWDDVKLESVLKSAVLQSVPSYFLCGSWYTSSKIMDLFIKKGFYTIGALKTNRVIYPCGIKQKIRSSRGIRRYWLLMSLAHLICCTGTGQSLPFEEGHAFFKKQLQIECIEYFYQCGAKQVPLDEVLALVG